MHTNHFIAIASLLFAGTLANCYKATIAYRDSSAGADEIKKKQTGMFLKTFFLYIAALIAFALYSLFAHWGRPFELGDSPFAILLLISQPILWCLTVKVPPKPSLDTEPKQGAYFRLALQPWFQPMQDFVMGQFVLTMGLLFYAFFEIHMGRSATPGAAMFLAAGLLMLVFSYLRLHKKLVRMLITASVIFPIVFLELAR